MGAIKDSITHRLSVLRTRIARTRYFRGHGVHSPFVYSIVRCVFMHRGFMGTERELYEGLLNIGVNRKRAVELQNIATHCNYTNFCIDNIDNIESHNHLTIISPALDNSAMEQLSKRASQLGSTIVILAPYKNRERWQAVKQLLETHGSTSIDRGAYILIINNALPKQHYRV